MGLSNLERTRPGYALLWLWLRPSYILFYRRFTVRGLENIPRHTPVIILPNHQNALMDALSVIFGMNRSAVFLARADIFRNPKVARILYFFKLMPIFRPRDGKENMSKNDAVFRRSVEVLRSHRPMSMFPEGQFTPLRSLFPFKKGFARIAFLSEQAEDWGLGIKVIPLGLDYTDKRRFYSDVVINFGRPIELSEFRGYYEDNPALGYNMLMERVGEELKTLMVYIARERAEYAGAYETMMAVAAAEGGRLTNYDRFAVQQRCAGAVNALDDEDFQRLRRVTEEYSEGLAPLDVSDRAVTRRRSFGRLVLSWIVRMVYPLLILPHLPPLAAPRLVLPRIKDPQFVASVKMVVWSLTSLVYYALLLLAVSLTPVPLWLKLALLPALAVEGLAARAMTGWWRQAGEYLKVGRIPASRLASLREKRAALISAMTERGLL